MLAFSEMSVDRVREGSVVYVRGSFGNDRPVKATVTEVCDDVKNGLPGIDYVTTQGEEHWAYMHQVDKVIKY